MMPVTITRDVGYKKPTFLGFEKPTVRTDRF
jgi:hypothetical protein